MTIIAPYSYTSINLTTNPILQFHKDLNLLPFGIKNFDSHLLPNEIKCITIYDQETVIGGIIYRHYSNYQDTAEVIMIEIAQPYKRQHLATQLLQYLNNCEGITILEGAILNSDEAYSFWKQYADVPQAKPHDYSSFWSGDHYFTINDHPLLGVW